MFKKSNKVTKEDKGGITVAKDVTWWVEIDGMRYTDEGSMLSVYHRLLLLSEIRGVRTTLTSVWELVDKMNTQELHSFISGWEQFLLEYCKYRDLVEGTPWTGTGDEYVQQVLRDTQQGLILDIMKDYWFQLMGEQYR